MNKIFRVVLNRKLGVWQVVGELARGRSKSASDTRRKQGGQAPAPCLRMKAVLLALGWGVLAGAAHADIVIDAGVSPDVASIRSPGAIVAVGISQEGNLSLNNGESLSNRGFVAGIIDKGSILIDGANTIWKSVDTSTVGASADGTLTLSNAGVLSINLGFGIVKVADSISSTGILTLGRKQTSPGTTMSFADAARSGNQRAVANAIERLRAGHALYDFILTLPDGAPAATFDSLSGEAHASVASSLMNASSTPRTLPFSHLRANLGAGMNPGAPTAQAGGSPSAASLPSSRAQPAWAEVIGNWQTMQGNDNSAQVRQHTGGIFVGADHEVGSGWRVGAALGYTDGKIKVDDRASQADVSSYSAALYGGKAFDLGSGKLNVLVGTSYTWHDIDTKRYATVASGRQELTASYGASTAQLFGELGYAMAMSDRSQIEPFAGVAWSDMRTRSFSEQGGIAALSGKSGSDTQTSTTLGVRGHYDFTAGRSNGRLKAMAGWRHAFGDVLPQSTMSFDGGQAFTVAGSPIARNAALAELGAEIDVSRNTTLGLSYSGQYGGGNREHAGSLNLRWKF